MRRYLSALAVALVALSGAARVWSEISQQTLAVVLGYDLDSTSFVYPIALGPTAVPSTLIRPQAAEGWYTRVENTNNRIKTAAENTTSVVSYVSASNAMSPLSTGDLVQVTDQFSRPVYVGVFNKTDNNTATFDRAVSLTQTGGANYKYRKLVVGSAIYDGWFSVADHEYTTIFISVAQVNVTGGIDLQVECAPNNELTAAQVLASSNITAVGGYAVAVPEPWDVCRVGLKIGTSDDDSADAKVEKISVYAIRR